MTPLNWNAALAPEIPWKVAYETVAREARALLTDARHAVEVGRPITTNELVDRLYPEEFARGAGITARKRIYKALAALEKHGLADCVTRGEPRKLKHTQRMVVPRLWHAPAPPASARETTKPTMYLEIAHATGVDYQTVKRVILAYFYSNDGGSHDVSLDTPAAALCAESGDGRDRSAVPTADTHNPDPELIHGDEGPIHDREQGEEGSGLIDWPRLARDMLA